MPMQHGRRVVRDVARLVTRAAARRVGLIDPPEPPEPPPPPKPPLSAEIQRMVFAVLRLLTPHELVGVGKRRVGGEGDGGYVLADCLTPAQPVLSLGIGPDVSFDQELAEQGHAIVMFDHTIDALPGDHPNFTWHRLGVAAASQPETALRSLADLSRLLPDTGAGPILKMDVEGAEWEALAATKPETLRGFTQIVLELHALLRLEEAPFNATARAALEVLTEDFVPVHVHGNNCGAQGHVGGFACPDVLEVTLIRRDLAATAPNATWYPTGLDRSNQHGSADFLLWGFPFAPGSEAAVLA